VNTVISHNFPEFTMTNVKFPVCQVGVHSANKTEAAQKDPILTFLAVCSNRLFLFNVVIFF